MNRFFVSPEWLHSRLGDDNVRVVDGSWYLPAQNRDAKAEFLAGHIPGAVFFDIDAIADRSSTLPHMLPRETEFSSAAGTLGLSETNTIIVYDGMGLFSVPRVWWTFRAFGAKDVRILTGGLPAWKRAGYRLEAGEAKPTPAEFRARLNREAVATIEHVREVLKRGGGSVVDARSAARFRGEAPEPRPGISSGHMPGSVNLPIDRLVGGDGQLAAPEKIRRLFEEAGADLTKPVVTTCGSGVTAAVLLLALAAAGKEDVSLYDGAWAEWASLPGNPIAGGPA
jgi:thiosulfate/3-mercaptopyruvate sulfurtransferase